MTSPIGGIPAGGFSVPVIPTPSVGGTVPVTTPTGTPAPQGAGFAEVLAARIDQVQGLHDGANGLAAQAVTGDLRDVHDYLIASNEAKLATEMVVTVKNKAVEAFNEIMRMPV